MNKRKMLLQEIRYWILTIFVGSLIVIGMTAMFFGAALQESYKLCPVAEEEVMEVSK